MTTEENVGRAYMLSEVEKQIRKDIPRLMELREGCWIDRIFYVDGEKFKNSLQVVNHTLPGDYYAFYNWANCTFFNTTLEDIGNYEIIGHDIMLNDVLEWIKQKQFFIDDLCIDIDGYLSLLDVVNRKFKCLKINWNLSSIYLKDQSEELIKFLYNLVKN